MRLVDISGATYGRWSVKDYAGNSSWNCECSCGTKRKVAGNSLIKNKSSSCGCRSIEIKTTHGKRNSQAYSSWVGMKTRCNNPSYTDWHRYGGRGISVDKAWDTFEQFFADVGDPPSAKHSLGRIDNNGNYEPFNVRWETLEQQNNNKVLNHKVTINGETKTLTQWARENCLNPSTVMSRVFYGWNEIDSVTIPAKRGQKSRRQIP